MANLMSGFFFAAATVSSLSRKPTVTIILQSASVRPLYEVWLNDLSSKPPESDTMQALKSELLAPPLALALLLLLALGAADEPPVPGAWAQLARVRTTAAPSA